MWFMLAVVIFGSAFTLAAVFLGSKQTAVLSFCLVLAFLFSASGQRVWETQAPWFWFSVVDGLLLTFVWKLPRKRRHIAVIAWLVFASLLTNVLYGAALFSGVSFTQSQLNWYITILNSLVYLQFLAVGWGIMDDRRWFKRMGILQGSSRRSLHADRRALGMDDR